jgi:hypothetical protein
VKLLEENIGKILENMGIGIAFLNKTNCLGNKSKN